MMLSLQHLLLQMMRGHVSASGCSLASNIFSIQCSARGTSLCLMQALMSVL